MKNTRRNVWIALLCMAVISAGCSSSASDSSATETAAQSATNTTGSSDAVSTALPEKATYKDDDLSTAWSSENPVKIALSGKAATIDGAGAEAKDGTVTITKAGTYVLSGKLGDGQIVVDVTKEEKVHLVLNGAEIKNSAGSAIHVKEAEKVIVTLQEGTTNSVTDGAKYADTSEEAPTGAIFSKGDLTVNGTGSLVVNGKYKDGLVSKDDLKIVSGTIEVHAVDDGIVGKDLVAVKEGNLTVEAGGDGIKSTNDAEASKGNIAIEGGTFRVVSGNDGLQAAASVRVDGGTFDIVTGGGSAKGKVHVEERGFGRPGQAGMPGANGQPPQSSLSGTNGQLPQSGLSGTNGQPPQSGLSGTNGQPPQPSTSGTDGQPPEQTQQTQPAQPAQPTQTAETETASAKAIKATVNIAVLGGTFKIDSADDSVHSNAAFTMSGGEMKLTSGDDGLHADASITIDGGKVDITKSYEGIESKVITLAGGDIHVVADDDGVNVSGGNDGSSTNGRAGQNQFAATGDSMLVIKGGNITVDSKGDGLDSNGSMQMSGGTVVVNGPTEDMNGPLDYDGTFNMTGGSLTAVGSAGMAMAPSEESTQRSILMTFSDTQKAGTSVHVKDANGKIIATVTPTKTYRSVMISSPNLLEGATYAIYSGDSKIVEFPLSKSVTWLNESGVTEASSGHGPGGMGGMRGGKGMKPQQQQTTSGQ